MSVSDTLGVLPLPELTTPEEGFDLAMESVVNGAVGKKDKLAGKDQFNAVVLFKVSPVPFSADQISAMIGTIVTTVKDENKLYGYRVRITDEASPHAFYPMPCDIRDQPTSINKVISSMHTLMLSNEKALKPNDLVTIKLNKLNGKYDLGYGYFISKNGSNSEFIRDEQEASPYLARQCSNLKDNFKNVDDLFFVGQDVGPLGTDPNSGLPIWGEATKTSPLGLPHGPAKTNWEGITIHYTAGASTKSAVTTLGKRSNGVGVEKRKVSYHYIIDKDGKRSDIIKDDHVAYHGNPFNTRHIGISLVNLGYQEQYAGDQPGKLPGTNPPPLSQWQKHGSYKWEPYTENQYNTLRGLIAILMNRYPTIKNINFHEDFSNSKPDPGPAFDTMFKRLEKEFPKLSRGPGPASTKNRTTETSAAS